MSIGPTKTSQLRTVRRMRSLVVALFCLAIIAGAASLALIPPFDRPMDASIVSVRDGEEHILPGGDPTKAVTIEFRRRNPAARFSGHLWVQSRIAGQWWEPETFPKLGENYLLGRTSPERMVFMVPARAEALRLLLEYRVGGAPYCRAYFFLQKHGVYRKFPNLCHLVLKCFPMKARLRHVELELTIPVESHSKALASRLLS
jgi:hypothetical protein